MGAVAGTGAVATRGIKVTNNNNPPSPNSIAALPQDIGSGPIEAPVAVAVLTSPVRYSVLFS